MKNKKKMPNKKRIIARIIALGATICVIMALAIPCFADVTVPNTPIPEVPVAPPNIPDNSALSNVQNLFMDSMKLYSVNDGLLRIFDALWRQSAVDYTKYGIFDYNYLVSGSFYGDFVNEVVLFDRTFFGETFFDEQLMFDGAFSYTDRIYLDAFSLEVGDSFLDAYFTIERTIFDVYNPEDYACYLDVTFEKYENNNVFITMGFYGGSNCWANIYYEGVISDALSTHLLLELEYLGFEFDNGRDYQDIGRSMTEMLNFTFIPKNFDKFGSNASSPSFSFGLATMILSSFSTDEYNYCVYYPSAWHDGYIASFQLGVNRGYSVGFNDGYREAWPDGYIEGYNDGYDVGIQGNTFQDGYNSAVADISSGDFGRNLLGGVFSAPFAAMREFVLVEWETQDGDAFTINIMMVFSVIVGVSLFIWFMKMFAGG